MMTMKGYAKQIEEGKYALAVINEDGFLIHSFVLNGTIDEVTESEMWINFQNLKDTEYVIRFMRTNKAVWMQEEDENGVGNWSHTGF